MDLEKFKHLPQTEKLNTVFTEGKFVDSVVKNEVIYALYSVRTYFVEIEYDSTSHSIPSPKAFEDGSQLNKYIDWS